MGEGARQGKTHWDSGQHAGSVIEGPGRHQVLKNERSEFSLGGLGCGAQGFRKACFSVLGGVERFTGEGGALKCLQISFSGNLFEVSFQGVLGGVVYVSFCVSASFFICCK